MFNQASFINQYTKSIANENSNMNRILNSSPSQTWEQLNNFQNKTVEAQSEQQMGGNGRLTGYSERLQGAMDMNPRAVNEKIAAERQAYNEHMLQTSGINNSVQEGRIVEEYMPVSRYSTNMIPTSNDTVKEPFDVKMKGRCGISEIIIIIFIIIAIFVFVNMYVSQKRMEMMLYYYGKFMKHMQKKDV